MAVLMVANAVVASDWLNRSLIEPAVPPARTAAPKAFAPDPLAVVLMLLPAVPGVNAVNEIDVRPVLAFAEVFAVALLPYAYVTPEPLPPLMAFARFARLAVWVAPTSTWT